MIWQPVKKYGKQKFFRLSTCLSATCHFPMLLRVPDCFSLCFQILQLELHISRHIQRLCIFWKMTLLITLRKVLINVKDAPYTFKFDEMITARTKKQYYVYSQYWSPAKNKITNVDCGSVFIGHCTSKDLVHHYHEFEVCLFHLHMDEPNKNKKFLDFLAVELEEKHNTQFLDLGTFFSSSCPHWCL